MKRWILIIIILISVFIVFSLWCRRRPSQPVDVGPQAGACVERAERQVFAWRQARKPDAEIERLYQAELARCSGAQGACAAFIGAINVDYAWLGRQVLSGSLAPAEYVARIRDRSTKLKQIRKHPDICDAYQRGDADGDLVPDESDRCADTPPLGRTGPDGCPDTSSLPPAPSKEAINNAAKALKVPLTSTCQHAPVPDSSAVLRAGLDPGDRDSFLIEVSPIRNQPTNCPVFYEIEARLRSSSLFSGALTQDTIRRVFRPADAVQPPSGGNRALVFRLRRGDPIPWNALVRAGIEPSDHAIKNLRVRAVNGNGSSAGWSSFRTREFRLNNRDFQ